MKSISSTESESQPAVVTTKRARLMSKGVTNAFEIVKVAPFPKGAESTDDSDAK